MIRLALILICVGSFTPIPAMAIEITEVAWMGSAESPNHEWIELYSPLAVDVSGWTITDGNNLSIELSGSLDADQYAVLERTSDTSAPGVAWQIYTGSLVNTGATLTLLDATGKVVDRVTGGEDWELIGGDNTTKATAQLSADGWITADPTPGEPAPTVTAAAAQPDTSAGSDTETESNPPSSQSTGKTARSSGGEQTKLTLPGITLQLQITAPQTAYVNQPIEFTASPSGVGSTIAQSLQYTWNFGDTSTESGTTVQHAYAHPGNYVVVVEAVYKRQIQRTRHEIVVLPVSLTLTELETGDIAIQNNSQTEIDLTGYRLVGNQSFTIPEYTIVLPRSQIVVARDRISTTASDQMIALYDPADQQAAAHLPANLTETIIVNQTPVAPMVASRPTPRISAIDDSPRYTFVSEQAAEPETLVAKPAPPSAQLASVGTQKLPSSWSHYALLGLLLFGITAVYLIPRTEKDASPFA